VIDWTMLSNDDEVTIVLWERLLKQCDTLTLIIIETLPGLVHTAAEGKLDTEIDVSAKATSKMLVGQH
jgi:hypothetical protein